MDNWKKFITVCGLIFRPIETFFIGFFVLILYRIIAKLSIGFNEDFGYCVAAILGISMCYMVGKSFRKSN